MEGKGVKALTEDRKDPEVKAVLEIMDGLLEKLPDDDVERFSKTTDYELYSRVLERYGVG